MTDPRVLTRARRYIQRTGFYTVRPGVTVYRQTVGFRVVQDGDVTFRTTLEEALGEIRQPPAGALTRQTA